MQKSTRAGKYQQQPGKKYSAFLPKPLPPDPPLEFDDEIHRLLGEANRLLGKLDGSTTMLPEPDLFVLMYIRHEAVLSSRIEDTQSTIEDVLKLESGNREIEREKDAQEVVNYIAALRHGLERLSEFPLSLRLIKEIHRKLMEGVRGKYRMPGTFRNDQRLVGARGVDPAEAEYIPPPPDEMRKALDYLESFLREDDADRDPLVRCGLFHAQFETIHPFQDGNGRMGRLLIVLLLCHWGILEKPVLYISHYINKFKTEYYERLQNIRDEGDWEGWIKFFLEGVIKIARSAQSTTRSIVTMRQEDRQKIGENIQSKYRFDLHDYLFEKPIVDINEVQETLGCAYQTANNLVREFEELNILEEMTGKERYKEYVYRNYYEKFDELRVHKDV